MHDSFGAAQARFSPEKASFFMKESYFPLRHSGTRNWCIALKKNEKMPIHNWVLFLFLVSCICTEASAMRPPLKPLDMKNLHLLVADAEVIAVGTVSSVIRSKTPQPPRETIIIRVVMSADKI